MGSWGRLMAFKCGVLAAVLVAVPVATFGGAAAAPAATTCPDQHEGIDDADAVIAFCSHVIESGGSDRKALANAYTARGKALYVQRKYDAALADASKAIQADPGDID